MAPLRSRANRAQGDDEASILKGLPIRQWRQTEQLVGPPPEAQPSYGKQLWPELPMPRDSGLLPEVSQQLLRAARAGRLYRPPTPPNDEDEKENGEDDEQVKDTQQGFMARKWSLLPRHLEEPEPEFLAKRRKGLPPSWGGVQLGPLAPQTAFRKTKVRKYDTEGNVHIYEVLAPEGQKIEGEVVEEDETVKAAPIETAAAPGTVVEGVGIVNAEGVVVANDLLQPTPPRRKPPPPRRKPKKGPGRGKKKVLFEPGADGAAQSVGTPSSTLNVPGATASDGASESAVPSTQGDTPMPDAHEGDEDESGSEGEEGEDGDEDGREEGELSPTPEPESSTSNPLPTAVEPPTELQVPAGPISPPKTEPVEPVRRDTSSSPELPLASKLSPARPGSSTQTPMQEAVPATAAPPTSGEAHFPDGEVDLFGSLEAALGNENKPEEAAKPKEENEPSQPS